LHTLSFVVSRTLAVCTIHLHTMHYALCSMHYALIHHTPHTTHHTPHTIRHTPYTIHHTPHTIHYASYAGGWYYAQVDTNLKAFANSCSQCSSSATRQWKTSRDGQVVCAVCIVRRSVCSVYRER
jgi:hypothetical protein